MSSHKSRFLQMEHARMAELEHQLESTHRESLDWMAEATEARTVEQLTAEWATTAERGLEVAKARQAETEAGL